MRKGEAQAWAREGGATRLRPLETVDVYARAGAKRERMNIPDMRAGVVGHLSPKLALSRDQRAVGTCYAAFAERITSIGYRAATTLKVDGSSAGGGGSERAAGMVRMISVAQAVLKGGILVYPLGKPRGEKLVGRHVPIFHRDLVDLICIDGDSLETVAVKHGWLVERADCSGKSRATVPDRQRKMIAEGLRKALDSIGDAWAEVGQAVPMEFFSVEFE